MQASRQKDERITWPNQYMERNNNLFYKLEFVPDDWVSWWDDEDIRGMIDFHALRSVLYYFMPCNLWIKKNCIDIKDV